MPSDEEGDQMIRLTRRGLRIVSAVGLSSMLLLVGTAPASASQVAVDCAADPSALQPAINAASAGSKLFISGTCLGAFTVWKPLTLKGAPATLDAHGTHSTVLTVLAHATVIGVSITGGSGVHQCGDQCGGGIRNEASLTLLRSTVSGNVAKVAGGIWNDGYLTLSRSTVTSNSASDSSGGIENQGTMVITNSVVSSNSAANAGGIRNVGILTISRSTVSGNSAFTYSGGGIFNFDIATLNVADSTVSGNSAVEAGGGIASAGGLTITRSTVSGNTTGGPGGGILTNTATCCPPPAVMTSSTVSGNSASSGGGIYDLGPISIVNSTVSGNSASNGGGGGIFIQLFSPGPVTLASSIDAGNIEGDCTGESLFVSNGYNLVGADCAFSSAGDQTVADTASAIGIKPLGNYGGKTQTMALNAGSPAVDAVPVGALGADGVTPLCPASGMTDQRGRPRPQGAGCDVGSYELRA